MRILHTLAWALVALACAAPNCDTHDAPLGSGSGSSAWARMPSTSSGATSEPAAAESGSAVQHQTVVHAMEAVTGATLERPTKSRPAAKHASSGDDSSGGGGNYGRSSSSSPPPPPKPELPESGRKLGQPCQNDDQCATNNCEFDVCAKKHYMDKVTNGEACSYDHDCVSDRCYHDICESR